MPLPLTVPPKHGHKTLLYSQLATDLDHLDAHIAVLGLPIFLWDERWSTQAVTRMMIDADTTRARRAELVDKLAASYILQGAIDGLAMG